MRVDLPYGELRRCATSPCPRAIRTPSHDLHSRLACRRYDLLCFEGLANAIKTFMGKIPEYPRFIPKPTAHPERIIVEPEIRPYRPFVVGAVLRNVTFDQARYQSFIDLQGGFIGKERRGLWAPGMVGCPLSF